MSSTFYSDGYRDAFNGEPCSPPDDYVRADGVSTDVYSREYLEGYSDAMRAFDDSMPDTPYGVSDANFDQFHC